MQIIKLLQWYAKTWVSLTTDFGFYRNLAIASLRKSIWFVLISYALLSIVVTIIFSRQVLPTISNEIQAVPIQIDNQLSADSQLIWDGTTLRIEPQQVISLAHLQFASSPEKKSKLINVSTTTIFLQVNGQTQEILLTELLGQEKFMLSKTEILAHTQNIVVQAERFLKLLSYFLPILFFANFLLSRSLFLALETTLLYFVLRIYRKRQKFSVLLKLTLHILVLAEVVNQWTEIVLPQSNISMLSVSFWVLLVIVLLQQYQYPDRHNNKTGVR
ncbi:MAG: hypothetical protein GW946_01380 [Candidatus Pacebacteria bacterium]|nr:hypothetical protein [Candidatus Paceibacterota bacterium]PIR60763.1 MAG: hypothetical protein COU67_00560 [Candidatus Pacebacteria bacterium CG10_big_fil_rev_8_21_14_0_10_44_54]